MSSTIDDVPAWDPFRTPDEVTHPVKASGGRATVTYRQWSGRERLAYEDAMVGFLDLGELDGADEQVKGVALGRMRLVAACLTMRGSSGFPPLPSGEAFDVTRPGHVEQLDGATMTELLDTALKVQPLPTAGASSDGDDGGSGDDGDPSPTPPTQQPAAASPSTDEQLIAY